MAVNWRGVRVVESSREGALTMENVIPCQSFFLYSERLAPLHVGKISLAVNLKFKTTRSPTTVSIFLWTIGENFCVRQNVCTLQIKRSV